MFLLNVAIFAKEHLISELYFHRSAVTSGVFQLTTPPLFLAGTLIGGGGVNNSKNFRLRRKGGTLYFSKFSASRGAKKAPPFAQMSPAKGGGFLSKVGFLKWNAIDVTCKYKFK